jgi:cell division protein FtsI (penicillin-binding protein 3)
VSYQASFVGFFPAEDPVYSCIVAVNAPSNSVYYGNLVAGPVFKEIADKVYATRFFSDPEDPDYSPPDVKKGFIDDSEYLLAELGIKYNYRGKGKWVDSYKVQDTVHLRELELIENLVPNVVGMGLRDALFLLENSGLKVTVTGRGEVVSQSLRPGVRIIPGSTINIELRNR